MPFVADNKVIHLGGAADHITLLGVRQRAPK
ncbi:MAG: hypothetical protein ACI8PP_000249 [Candidatus Pseudothioglobus sp.]|jgi:hypothetical protein